MRNTKTFLWCIAGTLALSLTGCFQQQTPPPEVMEDTAPVNEEDTGIVDAEEWNLYTNTDAGFSIQLPKVVITLPCDPVQSSMVAVPAEAVFEKYENNTYIGTIRPALQCAGGETDFESTNRDNGWRVIVRQARSEEELMQTIRGIGEGCTIREQVPTGVSGMYDVYVQQNDISTKEGGCFLGSRVVVKYSAEKGMVATWNMGQDDRFSDGERTFDAEMASSFRFL